MRTLGIDFGTTKTVAAYFDAKKSEPFVICLGTEKDEIPTTIYIDADKTIFTGDSAEDKRTDGWAGYVQRIKTEVGHNRSHTFHGQEFTTVDLIAYFLKKVVAKAEEEALHGKAEYVVVTVPAAYGPTERREMEEAIQLAGISDFELLDEPVAAAIAWMNEKDELGERIMVFDWGGGTLDVAVLIKDGPAYRAAPELVGGEDLGGEDIDDELIEDIDRVLSQNGYPLYRDRSAEDKIAIQTLVKKTKVGLTNNESMKLSFKLDDFSKQAAWPITRGEFNRRIADKVDQAVKLAKRQFDAARSKGITIDQVILIGGSSRIPLVSERLTEELGIKPLKWDRSREAVACGAAIKAAQAVEPHTHKKSDTSSAELQAANVELYKVFLKGATSAGNDLTIERAIFFIKQRNELGISEKDALTVEMGVLGKALCAFTLQSSGIFSSEKTQTPAWGQMKEQIVKLNSSTRAKSQLLAEAFKEVEQALHASDPANESDHLTNAERKLLEKTDGPGVDVSDKAAEAWLCCAQAYLKAIRGEYLLSFINILKCYVAKPGMSRELFWPNVFDFLFKDECESIKKQSQADCFKIRDEYNKKAADASSEGDIGWLMAKPLDLWNGSNEAERISERSKKKQREYWAKSDRLQKEREVQSERDIDDKCRSIAHRILNDITPKAITAPLATSAITLIPVKIKTERDGSKIFPLETFTGVIQGFNSCFAAISHNAVIYCSSTVAGEKELFKFTNIGSGHFSIRAANNKFVMANWNNDKTLEACAEQVKEWERFRLVKNRDGTLSIVSVDTKKFISADQNREKIMIADRDEPGEWERFQIFVVAP